MCHGYWQRSLANVLGILQRGKTWTSEFSKIIAIILCAQRNPKHTFQKARRRWWANGFTSLNSCCYQAHPECFFFSVTTSSSFRNYNLFRQWDICCNCHFFLVDLKSGISNHFVILTFQSESICSWFKGKVTWSWPDSLLGV